MWLIICATIIIGALLYKLFFSKSESIWKKYGILEIDTSPAVSNLDLALGRKLFSAKDDYVYAKMGPDEKFCGLMEMGQPLLIIKDMELIKRVLIKDFDHFVDRRQFFTEEEGIFHKQLPSLKGDEWKGVRSALSPTFTTGKIRKMMECFNDVAKGWVDEFAKSCRKTGGSAKINMNNASNQYTVDIISNTAFGMNVGTIQNPENEFAKMAADFTEFTFLRKIRFSLLLNFPVIRKLLKISLIDMTSTNYFDRILKQAIESRMSGQTERNDFLQLLIKAKKGELKMATEELESFEKDAQLKGDWQKKQYLTEEIMRAQCVIFFLAGFSTTSNFITSTAYALALHQDVQDKLRQEVGKIAKEDGTFDYDDIGKLVYLDMVTCESLRKFPALARLERICTKEYKDPAIGLVVPKDTVIGIPLNSIHNSKEFYEKPGEFYPEHFTPEKKAERNPYAYMPFGIGPRNCIGMRFALIEGKAAIAQLVHNFFIEPTPKTPQPLQGIPVGFGFQAPQNLELKLTLINSK